MIRVCRKRQPRFRPSFTLIELLVAIAILGTMAGMVLYSLAGAQTDARVARTRGTIGKLNEIILQRWEEYRYRPVNVLLPGALQTQVIADPSSPTSVARKQPVSPREMARVRMVMLRDWMRMEMPDRISDLLYDCSEYTVAFRSGGAAAPAAVKLSRPIPPGWGVLYKSLYNRIEALKAAGHPDWTGTTMVNIDASVHAAGTLLPNTGPTFLASGTVSDWKDRVQSSELLYLIVSTSNYNGSSALEYFRPTEIADTDDDGLLEFIDAWGQPIVWIRWPAGYSGDLVRYAGSDAMDPLQTDWRFRPTLADGTVIDADWRPRTLVPLILSRGQDAQLGVIADFPTPISYATMTWPTAAVGKPFGTSAYGVAGVHYGAPTSGASPSPYYYPDPHFTIDEATGLPNQPGSGKPWNGDTFPRNQLGAIPDFIDSGGSIRNEFWQDNITNHDIILEP